MPLTEEQVKELKSQLLAQIQHLPENQRKQAEEQIRNISSKALETMLEQQQAQTQKTIFRMIVDKEISSVIVEENEEALAVLDINPVSEGHIIIIPKNPAAHPQQINPKAFELAQKISNLVKENLKPSSVSIQAETKFGEAIIHVIPSYGSPVNSESPRKKSSPEELKFLLKKLKPEEIPKPEKIKKSSAPKEILKKQRRIP